MHRHTLHSSPARKRLYCATMDNNIVMPTMCAEKLDVFKWSSFVCVFALLLFSQDHTVNETNQPSSSRQSFSVIFDWAPKKIRLHLLTKQQKLSTLTEWKSIKTQQRRQGEIEQKTFRAHTHESITMNEDERPASVHVKNNDTHTLTNKKLDMQIFDCLTSATKSCTS